LLFFLVIVYMIFLIAYLSNILSPSVIESEILMDVGCPLTCSMKSRKIISIGPACNQREVSITIITHGMRPLNVIHSYVMGVDLHTSHEATRPK